jgi:hypothetical protein
MVNRLLQRTESNRPPPPGDYFVVCGKNWTYFVSTVMARTIERQLDRWWRLPWITFVDLSGSRIRVRSSAIEQIAQCTAEQRATDRAFYRSLQAEKKADPSWDEQD